MGSSANVSVNDFLLELAKVANERLNIGQTTQQATQSPRRHSIEMKNTSTPILKSSSEYPEVTLHPVSNQDFLGTSNSNSLLHGILTKQHSSRSQTGTGPTTNNNINSGFTSFSPTLARLLTAPERIAPLIPGSLSGQNHSAHSFQGKSLLDHDLPGGVVNLTNKPKSEITITPVVNSHLNQLQQSLIQNQLDQQQLHQHQQRLQQRQDASNMRSTKHLDLFSMVSFDIDLDVMAL